MLRVMSPRARIAALCLAAAALSLLVPSAPTTDPWGWIVWGREVLHLDLSTVVPGPPSWKPLPVMVTTPLALTGAAAPALWLVLARAGGLAALVVAGRLAGRIAGPVAAAVAVAGIVLSTDWLRAFAHGYTEPLAIGLVLAAADQHLSGRPRRAIVLCALAGLTRPEALLLALAYGAVELRRGRLDPMLVLGVAAGGAALWIVPDWIGSGDPLHASHVATLVDPTRPVAALHALGRALLIPPWPLALTAALAAAMALRRHDRRVLALAGATAAWVALLTVLMCVSYPAQPRFFMLPAGLCCVIGGVGCAWLAEATRRERRRLAAVAAFAAACLPLVVVRAHHSLQEGRDAVSRARLESELIRVVDRTSSELRDCGGPMLPTQLTWMKGAVAWKLDLPLRDVHAVGTTDHPYLTLLSDPENEAVPVPSGRRAVTIRRQLDGRVLLDPFGEARIQFAAGATARPETVASAGRWSAVEAGPGACGGPRFRRAALG